MADGPSAQVLPSQLVMIDNFLIDCSLNEEHAFESEVTEYPVESGSNITDNIRPKPIVVTMECLVTNTPIGFLAQSRGAGSGNPSDPADDAYELLQKIRDKREPISIRTSLRTFDNMVLKSLSVPRAPDRGDALRFTAVFQQIQVVTNKRTRRVAVPGGGKKVNKGQLPTVVKGLPGIPVISFVQSSRATVRKSLGNPILSTVEDNAGFLAGVAAGSTGGTTREQDGRGPLDHYKSPGMPHPQPTQFDGYVLNGRYTRLAMSGGSTTELQSSINGTAVVYDYNQQAWLDAQDNKKVVQKVPQKDRWKGVTVYNPKNGTGQTY